MALTERERQILRLKAQGMESTIIVEKATCTVLRKRIEQDVHYWSKKTGKTVSCMSVIP